MKRSSPTGPQRERCNIAIVDDEEFVRSGIAAILCGTSHCYVCGLGSNEGDAIKIVEEYRPDVLILDLLLGCRDGILLIKDLSARFPGTAILAISDRSELIYAERALHAGARGFLPEKFLR